MKNSIILWLASIILIVATTNTYAKFGLGISYGSIPEMTLNRIQGSTWPETPDRSDYVIEKRETFWLSVPIKFSNSFGVEPVFSFYRVQYEDSFDWTVLTGLSTRIFPVKNSKSFFVGFYTALERYGVKSTIYNGLEPEYYYLTDMTLNDTPILNFYFSPMCGGEFILSDQFSVGGEVGPLVAGYDMFGTNPDKRPVSWTIRALVTMRTYF
ncbi:hypothetical protein K8I28_03855 [bacterium]|nr:hypothetical protein [bacterium]